MKESQPPGRRLLFGLVFSAWCLGAGLLLSEGALRILGLPFRETFTPSENAIAGYDSELGWSYVPNRTTNVRFGRMAEGVAVHINGIGARVVAAGAQHDPSAPSVVFVGCSFTFGHGLPYQETFVGRLASLPDFRYQAVNLGVQGYGTDQALLILQRHLERLNVRIVVYTFMYDHPWRNANYDRRVFLPDGRFLGTKPLFGVSSNGTLVLERRPCLYSEYRYSRVVAALERARYLYGPDPSYDLTRSLVREMKRSVEARGARLIVVHWRWSSHLRGADVGLPFDGLGLDLIDTGIGSPAEFDTWRIPGDGHPDARAHWHVARLIQGRLAETDNR